MKMGVIERQKGKEGFPQDNNERIEVTGKQRLA